MSIPPEPRRQTQLHDAAISGGPGLAVGPYATSIQRRLARRHAIQRGPSGSQAKRCPVLTIARLGFGGAGFVRGSRPAATIATGSARQRHVADERGLHRKRNAGILPLLPLDQVSDHTSSHGPERYQRFGLFICTADFGRAQEKRPHPVERGPVVNQRCTSLRPKRLLPTQPSLRCMTDYRRCAPAKRQKRLAHQP